MKRILLSIFCSSFSLSLVCAPRPIIDNDYAELEHITRGIDPEAQLLVANLFNVMTQSVYAAAEEDQHEQMKAVNNVLTSVGNLVQLFINKAHKRYTSFMEDEDILELLNKPIIKKIILQRLKTDRPAFLKALKKMILALAPRPQL